MNWIFLLLLVFIKLTDQKVFKSTCKESENCYNKYDNSVDPFEILENLRNVKDTVLKDVMFETLKETVSKLNLPENVKDEKFLKETIETVMKSHQSQQDKNKRSSTSTATCDHKPSAKYAPYNGEVRLTDWHDLYHYFPQLSTTIRLWKLEFKESARQNWKRFRGCANPGRLVDWLVPDIEEVKKTRKKDKMLSRSQRQRDF